MNNPIFDYALEITDTLEAVDCRCAAADGPVTPTREEITDAELRKVYLAAQKIKALCD